MQTEERNPLAMRGILKDLTAEERVAIAAYVQSQGGARTSLSNDHGPRVGTVLAIGPGCAI